MFNFRVKTKLLFGAGTSEELPKIIEQFGFKKAAIIIDNGVKNHSQTKKILESLKKSSMAHQIFINDAVEPDYDFLENYKKNFIGQGFECLVGIGGGSTLDLTKGVATLMTNLGAAISYRGFPQLKNLPVPVIAIPTTAGTGSEVTFNAVFTDSHEKRKLGINSEYNFPVQAIIDPWFTVGSPNSVTVSAGADALVHTLESYVHKNHTPISRMYSKEAFRLLFNGLWKVLGDPNNIKIREDLGLGAYLAGTALMNAGSGPAGAFSYPLGTFHKVPHGYAGAVFLPEITRINAEKGYQDYAELYDLIDDLDKKISIPGKNKIFAEKIQELMNKLEVPQYIQKFNLTPQDVELLIEQYDTLKAAIDQNPIEITKDDVRKFMNRVFLMKNLEVKMKDCSVPTEH